MDDTNIPSFFVPFVFFVAKALSSLCGMVALEGNESPQAVSATSAVSSSIFSGIELVAEMEPRTHDHRRHSRA
jgi:hypothetical protein